MTNGLSWLAELPNRYGRVVTSASYVPQIDGLRFLAIIQVVIFHAMLRGERAFSLTRSEQTGPSVWLSHGMVGVELFFFISGYIVSYPFLVGLGPSYRKFLKRRLYRLEPPYIIALLGCFLLLQIYTPGADAPAFHHVNAPLWHSLAASLIYLHGLVFLTSPRINPPLWSLELEIQFYLLAPFLVSAFLAIGPQMRRATIGMLVILALILCQVLLGGVHRMFDFTILAHGYAFLLGIVACDHAVATKPFEKLGRYRYDLGLIVGLPLLIFSGSLATPFKGHAPASVMILLLRAASILMIYTAATRGIVGRRFFGARWIAFIGGTCYSIYLTHIPVLQATSKVIFNWGAPSNLYLSWIVAVVVLVPVATFFGLIFYLVVERPCMLPNWPSKLMRGDFALWGPANRTTQT